MNNKKQPKPKGPEQALQDLITSFKAAGEQFVLLVYNVAQNNKDKTNNISGSVAHDVKNHVQAAQMIIAAMKNDPVFASIMFHAVMQLNKIEANEKNATKKPPGLIVK